MIKPANDKIVVSVDSHQKEKISINGNDFLLGKEYSNNRRESMPVVCMVIDGNGHIKEGTFLLVHHNRFGENSPHSLGENLYSLAYNSSIFAKLDNDGNAHSLCGNIIVEYIYEESAVPLPAHLKMANQYKYKVASNGFGFKKGQIVFCYEKSDYEIVYVFNGQEKRVVKVKKEDIVGKLV
jgi:hypothetical protein